MGAGTDTSEMQGHTVDVQNELDPQQQRHRKHGNTTGQHNLSSMGIQREQYVLIVAVVALLGMLFAVLWVVTRPRLTTDEALLGWQRLQFRLKVLSLVCFSFYNMFMDWMQLFIFFRLGFPVFGMINMTFLVLPPMAMFVFFSFVLQSESKWTAPLYILQKHVLDCAHESWTKGRVSFTLVWAVAFAACFEAMPSSLLGCYAVVIAPEIYCSTRIRIAALFVCGPLIAPVVITSWSVVAGVLNVAKVLSKDLDYYGYGRLELKKNQRVMAYRWCGRKRSPEPVLGHFRYAKDYCACVVFAVEDEEDDEDEEEEIPISWLCDVQPPEGVSVRRYISRFIYRCVEVTSSIMTVACFGDLCRRENLSPYANGNMWPIFLLSADFAINYWMVGTRNGSPKLDPIFAAMFTVMSPPLMLPQFDKMQLPHVITRFVRLTVMFLIVWVKNGWDQIMRRTSEFPILRLFVLGSTLMYLLLAPLQLYTEMPAKHFATKREHSQYIPMSQREVPRVLRAALLDGNCFLIRMLAQFLPMDGTLVFALERGATTEAIHELLDLQVDIPEGVLNVATQGDAEHEVLVRLLKAGCTARTAPLRHALRRGASYAEVAELLDCGAEVYDDVFDTILEQKKSVFERKGSKENWVDLERNFERKETLYSESLHPILVELLRHGATSREKPLRAALEHRCTERDVLELLRSGAEVYDGVLADAATHGASLPVTLALMQHGGGPLDLPIRHALECQEPLGAIQRLLDAKAQLYDGVLQTAVSNAAPHSVITLLLKLGGTPRDVPLSAQLKKGGEQGKEVSELLQARAEVYDGILKTAEDFSASYNTVLILLKHGGTPRHVPLRRALLWQTECDDILALLAAGAEVYNGVLTDACNNAADHKVVLELLRRGGLPKALPLPKALERGASLAEVRELLAAGAEKTEGLLQVAVDSGATVDVFRALVQTQCDLVCEQGVAEQDMTRPLTHYWINSSHNTYLEGGQVGAKASAQQYVETLRRGCRCVELDIWNGKVWNMEQPVVTHGYAFCDKIPLHEVLVALKEHAFDYTEYPLILSLEMHCRRRQRNICRKLFVEAFGDALLYPPEDTDEELVSPAQARGKIILKSKISKFKEGNDDENPDSKEVKGFLRTSRTTRRKTTSMKVPGWTSSELSQSWNTGSQSGNTGSQSGNTGSRSVGFSDDETYVSDIGQRTPSKTSGTSEVRSQSAPPRSAPPEDRIGLDRGDCTGSSDYPDDDSDDAPSVGDVPVHEREEVPPDWLSPDFDFFGEICRLENASVGTAEIAIEGTTHSNTDLFTPQAVSIADGSERTPGNDSMLANKSVTHLSFVHTVNSTSAGSSRQRLLRALSLAKGHLIPKLEATFPYTYADCIYMPSCKFKEYHITGSAASRNTRFSGGSAGSAGSAGSGRRPRRSETRTSTATTMVPRETDRAISSFVHGKMEYLCKKFRSDLRDYHHSALSRVYPPGHHILSQNYDPTVHWAHGVQMVALNFQTFDRHLLLNEAFFRYQNGGVGYVLKPFLPGLDTGESVQSLRVRVVSAHFFPPTLQDHQTSSVCVGVGLCGGNGGTSGREGDVVEYQTEYVEVTDGDAGYDSTFHFNLTHIDTAILIFTVFGWSSQRAKQLELVKAAYPVCCVRMGTRFVPLWDLKHRPLEHCGLIAELGLDTLAPEDAVSAMGALGSNKSNPNLDKSRRVLRSSMAKQF